MPDTPRSLSYFTTQVIANSDNTATKSSFIPGGSVSATNVQAAILEVAAESGAGMAAPLASSTTTGTVKTNTNAADPVVYLKSETDTLLAAKANTSQLATAATSTTLGTVRTNTTTATPIVYLNTEVDTLDAANVKLTGNQTIAGNKTLSGVTDFSNTTAATSTTLAGVTFKGGVGVSGALFVGGKLDVSSSVSSQVVIGANVYTFGSGSIGFAAPRLTGLALPNSGVGIFETAATTTTNSSFYSKSAASHTGFHFEGRNSSNTTVFSVGASGVVTSSGRKAASRNITASTTTTINDEVIFVDATSGNVTITLVSAATAGSGALIKIIRTDASANTVTVTSVMSNGSLVGQFSTAAYVSNGTNWYFG